MAIPLALCSACGGDPASPPDVVATATSTGVDHSSQGGSTDAESSDDAGEVPESDAAGSSGSTGAESSGGGDPVCGDGRVEAEEACDSGPANGDGTTPCTSDCKLNACGDGYVFAGEEECDDADANGGYPAACSLRCAAQHAAVAVATGWEHTCVLFEPGTVRCWGFGGKLGYAQTDSIGDDEVLPDAALGDVVVGGTVVQIAAGLQQTCVVLDTGALRCWGDAHDGVLGYGSLEAIGDDEDPSDAGDVDVGGDVVQVATGRDHTCVLLQGGTVRCWGAGPQRGYPGLDEVIGDDETPSSVGVVDVGGDVSQLAAGELHTCALLVDGNVRCWGHGQNGQLGYGDTNTVGDDETPAMAGDVSLGGPVVQVAARGRHTCARTAPGDVLCWGSGQSGQLGYVSEENIGDDELPSSVGPVTLDGGAVDVVTGMHHTCALLETGDLRCWGANSQGELGLGHTMPVGVDIEPVSMLPVMVGGTVVALDAGVMHTCAVLDTGAVRCWGAAGMDGYLGYGNLHTIGDDEHPQAAGDVPVY